MKFLKYPDGYWWEWDAGNMWAFNVRGGGHNINENELGECEFLNCESWHDLYIKTGFNPLKSDITGTGWISPAGEFYPCDAHEIDAIKILEVIYGIETDCLTWGGDELISKGWIKVTTSCMFEIYCEEGLYNKPMTHQQRKAFREWMAKNDMTERYHSAKL